MTVPHPIYTLGFWSDTLERVVSAAAISALSVIGISGFDWISAPWYATAGAAGMGAVLELLRALAAAHGGNPGTAAITRAVEASPETGLIGRIATTGRHAAQD